MPLLRRTGATLAVAITLSSAASLLPAACSATGSSSAQSGLLGASSRTLVSGLASSPTSPFDSRIAADAGVDPDSAEMAAGIARAAEAKGFSISTSQWTVPVYQAQVGTPRVTLTVQGRPPGANLDPTFVHNKTTTWRGVPMPPSATPDRSADAHLTIVDTASKCRYDLYGAKQTAKGWTAAWMNAQPVGSYAYANGLSSRASGISPIAGAIWPQELAAGRIDHALAFNFPYTRTGGPVWPATASDGKTAGNGAIPTGARVRLDPSLDLDTLNLTPQERTIATALQDYGMYLVDTGGAVGLYAIDANSFSDNAYAGQVRTPYQLLKDIPVDRFQVMELGPQTPAPALKVIDNRCTTGWSR